MIFPSDFGLDLLEFIEMRFLLKGGVPISFVLSATTFNS